MKNTKLLLFMFAVLVFLILIGSLLGAFIRLANELRYSLEYFLPYWLVNPILLIFTGIIIYLFIQVAWPWWKNYYKNKTKISSNNKEAIKRPRNKQQAAKQSLESIDRLIDRIQNQVSSKALREQRERVEKELTRGDLIVAIFGTGSSGKTSLIRAMLNEIVGVVGSPMGSTTTSKTYRLRLKGLNRGLQLIDTPGILEAGEEGFLREKEARLEASRSDLIIVVVDSDLRSSEMHVIKSLAKLGKRIFLVLNKCDLRGEAEEQRLLELLKMHSKGLIDSEDVISSSAAPQSIPKPGSKPFQPKPEIEMLLRRLAKVLHHDGEELLADNILLQCRNLGDQGRELLNRQRKKEAQGCIDRYSWISSGVVAVTPLPGIDLVGTAAVNAQMVMEIARIYGVQLTKSRAQELAVSVGRTLAGLGIVKGGVSVISTALNLNLPTLLAGKALQSVAAAWLTRIAGASFITYFQRDQDWGDGGIQEVVQLHYDLNRRESILRKFIETALLRVVDPLQRNQKRQLPPRSRPQEEGEA